MYPLLLELCTFTVLCFFVEALFTGIADPIMAFLRKEKLDLHFQCRTQLWGVFVYGISATVSYPLLSHLAPEFFALHWVIRGVVYMLGIYMWEYFWGALQERTVGSCAWQYTDSRHAILRYINPKFFVFWFGFGFVLEWIHLELVPVLMNAFL